MIFTTHRGIRYGIQFSYLNDRLTGTNRVTRNTMCTVLTLPENVSKENPGTPMGIGMATQHPSDNFCRETGRKISLARALKVCGALDPIMDKEFRTQIWEAYRNRNVTVHNVRDDSGRIYGEGC